MLSTVVLANDNSRVAEPNTTPGGRSTLRLDNGGFCLASTALDAPLPTQQIGQCAPLAFAEPDNATVLPRWETHRLGFCEPSGSFPNTIFSFRARRVVPVRRIPTLQKEPLSPLAASKNEQHPIPDVP